MDNKILLHRFIRSVAKAGCKLCDGLSQIQTKKQFLCLFTKTLICLFIDFFISSCHELITTAKYIQICGDALSMYIGH